MLVGWLAGRPAGWLWLAGRLAGWLAGWLVGLLVDYWVAFPFEFSLNQPQAGY